MSKAYTILLLEDEPVILMDLEFAAEDYGSEPLSAAGIDMALRLIATAGRVDVGVLDVSLGNGTNCVPVACELRRRGIPFILYSGDLDRQEETVRELEAPLIAKPMAADKVIAAAIGVAQGNDGALIRCPVS